MSLPRVVSTLALFGLILVAGCYRGSVTIAVHTPPEYADRDLDYILYVYARGEQSPVKHCSDFEFGRHHRDELAGALVAFGDARGQTTLTSVPREGEKLLILEATSSELGRAVLFGCAEVGDVVDDVKAELELVPLVTLMFNQDELLPVVPIAGEAGALDPVLVVKAVNAFGEPVATDVRWKVHARYGAESTAADSVDEGTEVALPASEEGSVLDVTVPVLGPFTVAVMPRLPASETEPPIGGFAIPDETAVHPFGQGATAAILSPFRLHDGRLAILRFVEDAGPSIRYSPDLAVSTEGGAPGSFDIDLLSDLTAPSYLPLAAAGHPTEGASYLLREWPGGLRPGGIVRVSPEKEGAARTEVVFPSGTVLDYGDTSYGIEELGLRWSHIQPLGSCDDDAFAAPLLMFVKLGSDDRYGVALLDPFADDEADRLSILGTIDTPPPSFRTVCVGDGTKLHRMVLIFESQTSFRAIDLGDGRTMASATFDEIKELIELSTGTEVPPSYAAGLLVRDGVQSLVTASRVRSAIRLLSFRALPSDDNPNTALDEPTELYALPAVPTQTGIGSGRLFGPDARGDHFLFRLAAETDDQTDPAGAAIEETTMVLAVDPGPDDKSPTAGALFLDDCLPSAMCTMLSADLEGDGVDEVVAVRQVGALNNGGDQNGILALDNVPVVVHAIRFWRE